MYINNCVPLLDPAKQAAEAPGHDGEPGGVTLLPLGVHHDPPVQVREVVERLDDLVGALLCVWDGSVVNGWGVRWCGGG